MAWVDKDLGRTGFDLVRVQLFSLFTGRGGRGLENNTAVPDLGFQVVCGSTQVNRGQEAFVWGYEQRLEEGRLWE